MKALCFSGWAQRADALDMLARKAGAEVVTHVDYLALPAEKDLWAALEGKKPGLVIGWSLGGMLAVKAIEKGLLDPRMLVLLATPFQFVADMHFPQGMSPTEFSLFAEAYEQAPEATLKGFRTLMLKGDDRKKDIRDALGELRDDRVYARYWLDWLRRASLAKVDFDLLPPGLIVHGLDDRVVDCRQVDAFMEFYPRAEIVLLPGCGHVPHLHDMGLVAEEIRGVYASL